MPHDLAQGAGGSAGGSALVTRRCSAWTSSAEKTSVAGRSGCARARYATCIRRTPMMLKSGQIALQALGLLEHAVLDLAAAT